MSVGYLKNKKNNENDLKTLMDLCNTDLRGSKPVEELTKSSYNAPEDTDNLLASILKDLEMAETCLESTSDFLDTNKVSSVLMKDLKSTERNYEHDSNYQEGLTGPLSVLKHTSTEIPHRSTFRHQEKTETASDLSDNVQTPSLNVILEQRETEESNEEEKPAENLNNEHNNTQETVETTFSSRSTEENNTLNTKKESDFIDIEPTPMEPDTDNQYSSNIGHTLNIPIPTSNPYFNFVQDFRAKYKGEEVTPTVMVTLAAKKWRNLQDKEKQNYVNIGKYKCRSNQAAETLKNYIKWMDISVED